MWYTYVTQFAPYPRERLAPGTPTPFTGGNLKKGRVDRMIDLLRSWRIIFPKREPTA